MQLRGFLAVLPWLAVALSAGAADLTISAQGEVAYDNNVFREDEDEDDDILLRVRPGVRLHEDRGDDVNYSIRYDVPFEFAVDNSEELQDVDHVVRGTIDYHVNDQLTFFASDDLRFLRSTLGQEQTAVSPIGDGVSIVTLQGERDRVTLNDGAVGFRYLITPRWLVSATARGNLFETSRDDRSDNYSVGGNAQLVHTLTRRHQLGGGVRYNFQEFDDRLNLQGSKTDTYGVFATWRWQILKTLTMEVQGGPSYIETDQNDANVLRVARAAPAIAQLPAGPTNLDVTDSTGATIMDVTAAPGSVLVPRSCDNLPGTGTQVAQLCPINVGSPQNVLYLDPSNPNDLADIGALLTTATPLTNVNPSGEDDSGIEIFANVTITQQWTPTLRTALNYTRRQGNAAGLGGTVITDLASIANTWDFLERWELTARADYTQRNEAFRVAQTFDNVFATTLPNSVVQVATRCASGNIQNCPGGTSFNSRQNADVDTRRWGVAGRVTHRLFRTTLVFVQVRYDRQDSDTNSLGRGSDFENIIGSFGVRHTFEPITLW